LLYLAWGGGDIMDWMTAPTKKAQEVGRKTGEINSRAWIKLTISHWALLEQIRSSRGYKNEHEAMAHCIMEVARKLGLEVG